MCMCRIAAMTECVYSLFGATVASSCVLRWEEQQFRICIGYKCIHAGKVGMTVTILRAEKLNRAAPQLPISPPLSWTLEASIPPSTLALIITKDRMHKTWRTLRQRRPRSPFSPHTEPLNNTWAPLACDSDDTHAVFLSSPISLSSSSSSSVLLCSVE